MNVLVRAGIAQELDPVSARVLSGLLQRVEFWRGSVIFGEGEPGDRLYVIAAGKVKVGRSSADGREHLLMVAGPGDIIGSLSVFDPGPRLSTATALNAVAAYTMDRAALREWIATRPEIGEKLLQVLARRLHRANNALADLVFTDVPGRVAKALLALARQFGSVDADTGLLRVDHDLTQADLAALVGSSRETVNKTLAGFADRGWLRLESRGVVILQPERLARRAR